MSEERVLVTGATGCIGAWIVKKLIKEDVPVWACSRHPEKADRLKMIMSADDLKKVNFFRCDVSDFDAVNRLIKDERISSVIHLAALQLPFCAADPIFGAEVNVVGTVNLFEAAVRNEIDNFVFSSSTAVYGKTEEYGMDTITEDMLLKPASHYGIYKQANEGAAKVYWNSNGFSSIGLRPYVAYGPGRDQGMTSTPTKALIAAVLNEDYKITFGGRYCFQYAADLANAYIKASRAGVKGYRTYNIGGPTISSGEFVEELLKQVPEMAGRVSHSDTPLPFPADVDNSEFLQIVGGMKFTSLSDGIARTLEIFRKAKDRGLLSKEMLK